MQTKNKLDSELILFYDSYCVLCNRFIKLLLKIDKKAQIKLAPINGENYQLLINQNELTQIPDSIIFYSRKGISYKGNAVLSVIHALGFPYSVFLVFKILPNPLLNFCYDLIAVNRYKIFGKYDTCPIIPLQYSDRFIT